MKECCRSGCDSKLKPSRIKKWLNYLLYLVISFIVLGAILLQLFGEKWLFNNAKNKETI